MSENKRRTKVRFAAVGVLNTCVDIGLYALLLPLLSSILLSNTLSTTAGLLTSYTLNRKFTFNSRGNKKREIILFLAVTLTGLWILQPLVIFVSTKLLEHTVSEFYSYSLVSILLPKLFATSVTLIWNYLLYKKYIFIER